MSRGRKAIQDEVKEPSDGDTPKPVLKEPKAIEDEVQEESDGNTDAFNATTSGDEEKGKLN